MPKQTLIDFLDGDDNHYGLDAVATHGFLCATIVGPALAGWLDVLFDGEKTKVAPDVLTAISQWRKDIEVELKDAESIELPIEDDALGVESELGDWCVGFVDAMYANEDTDWFEVDDDVATLTLPMVVFSGIEEDDPELMQVRKNAALLEQMATSMEDNLTQLYLLFHTP